MFVEWSTTRVFVRPGATDLRKQINGLAILVQTSMNMDPLSGQMYLFSNHKRRLLKVLYYRGFLPTLGATRPTEAIIIDAVDSSLVTAVKFADYRLQDIPEAWFQRDYLPRLKVE